MTSRSRTLLLLGVTALAGTLSGCIIQSSDCPNLPEQRYFAVRWEVDNGENTPMLLCGEAPAATAHVELLTSTSSTALLVGSQQCDATSGVLYNFSGVTQAGLPTGTVVTRANLIGADGSLLSYADVPPNAQLPIRACQGVAHTFEFPL